MDAALVEMEKPLIAGAIAEASVPGKAEVINGVAVVPYGNETSTIRINVVRYCQGVGLDLGCGGEKIIPQAIGIDAQEGAANIRLDFGKLFIFSDNVFDFCYSSHAIEDVYYKEPVLREWWRVIKPNGYLILAWPDWNEYPDDGIEYNISHKDKVEAKDFKRILSRFHGEIVLETKVGRSQILVVRKFSSSIKASLKKKELHRPEKSALVVRYGAFGDAIIVTPVLRALHKHGYHVTVNTSDYCQPVFENNPNIDEVIVHQRDCIKNDGKELPAYWDHLSQGTDRFINLSGSIEGSMLLLEGVHPMGCDAHKEHYVEGCEACESCRSIRDGNLGSENYYRRTMHLAGFDPDSESLQGELFFTHGEYFRAKDLVRKWRRKNHYVVIWSLAGSSFHKAYPYWGTVAVEFCRRHPDAIVYTVGDKISQLAEVVDHPQIRPRSSKWTIRESMIMTQYADMVIGGETGVMHAAACYDTPKIALLSHSTETNLCATWSNYIALAPDRKGAPCYPCHQLHYSKESCMLKPFPTIVHLRYDEPPVIQPPPEDLSQHWPACMTHGIALDRVLNAMEQFYRGKKR